MGVEELEGEEEEEKEDQENEEDEEEVIEEEYWRKLGPIVYNNAQEAKEVTFK